MLAMGMAMSAFAEPFAQWVDVVGKIRSGDDAGVEDLYAALSDGVCASLFRNVDAQSIEDGLHEILIVVLEAIRGGELRDPRRLLGFVRTVTRRRVAAHIRSAIQGRQRFVPVGAVDPVAPVEQSPEERTAQREQVDRVRKVLNGLRPRDREIVERFYLREQVPRQICEEMGLTMTQFRLYKSRAIARCFDLARRTNAIVAACGVHRQRNRRGNDASAGSSDSID